MLLQLYAILGFNEDTLLPLIENTVKTILYPNIPKISFEISGKECPSSEFLLRKNDNPVDFFREEIKKYILSLNIRQRFKSTRSWQHV